MQAISENFEALHGIPYVVGAIDGSHIPIIAPEHHAADYYYRKIFHSVLLQVVVDHSCCFWDYDIGWCGSIHDYNLFYKSHIGKYCLSGKLFFYALLGDATTRYRAMLQFLLRNPPIELPRIKRGNCGRRFSPFVH